MNTPMMYVYNYRGGRRINLWKSLPLRANLDPPPHTHTQFIFFLDVNYTLIRPSLMMTQILFGVYKINVYRLTWF